MKMSNEKNVRKEELISYINLLRGLSRDEFRCEKELNKALAELHDLMFEEKRKKQFIIVLEREFDGVDRAVKTYQNILGSDARIRRVRWDLQHNLYDHEIRAENIIVLILKIQSINDLKMKLNNKGYTADYLINNTLFADEDIKVKLSQ